MKHKPYPIIYNRKIELETLSQIPLHITRALDRPDIGDSVKEIQTQKIPLTKNKGETMIQIPLICTTTIEIPLILEIQRTRRVYLYEPREDRDIEIVYLPDFEKRDRKKKD